MTPPRPLAIRVLAGLPRFLGRLPRRTVWTALLLSAAVLALGTCAYAWAAKGVVVAADGRAMAFKTFRPTVESVLTQAGVELGPRDLTEPAPGSRVEDGCLITVKRAVPLAIVADGSRVETASARDSVRAVLLEAGIALGEDDRTEPPADETPAPGTEIRVVRVTREFETVLWRIPRKVYRRDDETLELGLTRVVEKGADGAEEVVFCTTYEDGAKAGRAIVDRKVVKEPVPETILVGTSGQISRGGEVIRFRRAIEVTSTGYYWGPECTGKYADGYTSIGLRATRGIIAVDPRVIPLGTRVYVDGYGSAIAGDIGSAIRGNKIDCCFDTYQEALNWGRRKTKVYLLW